MEAQEEQKEQREREEKKRERNTEQECHRSSPKRRSIKKTSKSKRDCREVLDRGI